MSGNNGQLHQERDGRIPFEILSHPDLSPTAKLVYAALERYAFKDGSCFTSQSRLARDIRRKRSTVFQELKKLEKLHLISAEIRKGKTSIYYLLAGRFAPDADQEPVQNPEQVVSKKLNRTCSESRTHKLLKEANNFNQQLLGDQKPEMTLKEAAALESV